MKQMRRVDTPAEVNEYYPKVIVKSDGYTRVDVSGDLPVSVDGFILEPALDYTGNDKPFYVYSEKEGGVLFNMPPLGDDDDDGEILVTPFLTTFGSSYGGDTWIGLPIPEPTTPIGSNIFTYDYENTYILHEDDGNLPGDFYPIELPDGSIFDPTTGSMIDSEGVFRKTYPGFIPTWGIFTNNGAEPYSYSVIHLTQTMYDGGGGAVS